MRRPLALVLVAAALGCSNNGSSGGDGGAPSPDLAPANATCVSDNQPIALAAHYAVRATLNLNVKVPAGCTGDACIVDQDALSTLLLLADLTQNGTDVMVDAHPCHLDIPPVTLANQPMPIQLTAPDKLVQTVASVLAGATLGGSTTCAAMNSQPIPILLGAQLKRVATDPLPVFSLASMPPVKLCGGNASVPCGSAPAGDVPCICDQDADGKPGATVAASGLPGLDDVDAVYLALRTVISLQGQVWPPIASEMLPGQRIKGTVANLTLEQSPVGCHHMGMGGAGPSECTPAETDAVAKLNPEVTQSTNATSTFVAVPVAASETCTLLSSDAATLFAGE